MWGDRKSTRLNSSHTEIYTLSLHDALPIFVNRAASRTTVTSSSNGSSTLPGEIVQFTARVTYVGRSEEHTSELQSHRDLHSFPTRRSSDLRESRCFQDHSHEQFQRLINASR